MYKAATRFDRSAFHRLMTSTHAVQVWKLVQCKLLKHSISLVMKVPVRKIAPYHSPVRRKASSKDVM